MKEVIVDLFGYEGLYKISNYGYIYSIKYNRKLKGSITPKGYICVSLCKDSKPITKSLHRLVAIHFIPNPFNKLQINHIDGNKWNNNVNNLEWCDNSENQIHRCRILNKINHGNKVLRVEDGKVFNSAMEASKYMGLSKNAISNCCLGYVPRSGGYHWQYIN